jgi:hypothetical protein
MAGQLLVAQPRGCGARLKEGTAIPAEIPEAMEGQVAAATLGRSLGALAVLAAVVALALLPALVAVGPASAGLTSMAVAAGGLVAVVGGGKLAVLAWGLASSESDPGFQASVSFVD